MENEKKINNDELVEEHVQEKEVLIQEPKDDFKDKFIRLSADFENFRRRTNQERIIWAQSAKVNVFKPLLDIIDNCDRALANKPALDDAAELAAWVEGITLILKSLRKVLEQQGVTEIIQVTEFDPQLHEALMRVQSDDHESGMIVQVLQPGYVLGTILIRPAKVSVAE